MAEGLETMAQVVPATDELQQQERHEVLALCRALSGIAEEMAERIGLEPPDEVRVIRERNEQ